MKTTTRIEITIENETDEPDPTPAGEDPRGPMSPGAEKLRAFLREIYRPIVWEE
jgi:hypothetical protein